MPLNPPDTKEIRAIVDWVNLTGDVRELSITFGDVELYISRDRKPAGG
jgi:acetyl-CoA carboxylase biotin carboxyl carrier protein